MNRLLINVLVLITLLGCDTKTGVYMDGDTKLNYLGNKSSHERAVWATQGVFRPSVTASTVFSHMRKDGEHQMVALRIKNPEQTHEGYSLYDIIKEGDNGTEFLIPARTTGSYALCSLIPEKASHKCWGPVEITPN